MALQRCSGHTSSAVVTCALLYRIAAIKACIWKTSKDVVMPRGIQKMLKQVALVATVAKGSNQPNCAVALGQII